MILYSYKGVKKHPTNLKVIKITKGKGNDALGLD